MWVGADAGESEFHHVRAPDDAAASGPQTCHGGRIAGCGGCVLQGEGACRSDLPGHIKKIFDRNSQPSQRQVCCFCVVKALALGFKALGHKGVGGGGGLRQAHGFVHRLGGSQDARLYQGPGCDQVGLHGCARIFGFCCMQWRVVLWA